jgi:hypothetical protein
VHLAQSRWPSRIKDKRHLFAAMRKYPEWSWVTEAIAAAQSWSAACDLERKLIAQEQSADRRIGYNSTKGGDGANGLVHSAEFRKRLSALYAGKKRDAAFCAAVKRAMQDPDVRARCVAPHIGRKQTAEEVERRASKLRGRQQSAETRAKKSAAARGRKKTPEHIAKIIASRRGWKPSSEQAARVGDFHRGRKRPPETGARISAGLRQHHLRRKAAKDKPCAQQ